MDKIVISDIPLDARVGCTWEERSRPQRIYVDLELDLDLGPAGTSDELSSSMDYVEIHRAVKAVIEAKPFALIEAIAEAAAARLLSFEPACEALVRVRKPSALAAHGVPYAAVEIRRRAGQS